MTDQSSFPVDVVLATSWALSDEGRDWVPASARGSEKEPTADKVRRVLTVSSQRETRLVRAQTYLQDNNLISAIRDSAEDLDSTSRYAATIRKALSKDQVPINKVGLVASLVRAYRRRLDREELQEGLPRNVAGWLGDVGARLTDLKLTVTHIHFGDTHWGTSTFLVGTCDDGHVVVWKASKFLDLEPGDKITLAQATIKALNTYEGIDQTIVTRARLA